MQLEEQITLITLSMQALATTAIEHGLKASAIRSSARGAVPGQAGDLDLAPLQPTHPTLTGGVKRMDFYPIGAGATGQEPSRTRRRREGVEALSVAPPR